MNDELPLGSFLALHDLQITAFSFVLLVCVLVLMIRYRSLKDSYQSLLSQKKSSEVRTGKVAEVLAPFIDSFPVDVKKPGTSTVFLGQPIDYIHFNPEEGITFIEVKSGNSDLSTDQRKIKKTIESGKVFWKQVQIKD